MTITLNACFIAQSFMKGKTQTDAYILDCMVPIDLKVTLRLQGQIE